MRLLKETLDFMFPHSCLICGKISDLCINGCRVCKRCLSRVNPVNCDKRWHLCLSEPYSEDKYPKLPLFVPFGYQNEITSMVYGLKFGGKPQLGTLMGSMLGEIMYREGITADLVVPIPLSDKRFKERGYNQAGLIAMEVAKKCDLPFVSDILLRNRNTNKQAECKSNEERYKNIMGAFNVNDTWDIEGLKIILVDDVVTTGSTMHEAATVLMDYGALAVLCCAFASRRMVVNDISY